ncbi:MAG TPA: RNase adapter RapZ [Acidimicrobiia bacterium]|nr:RNase adapter RapZ [Acidimicrobiia bacterium]
MAQPVEAVEMVDRPHVLVVTGMSGAGKSSAANVLEDNGYNVIDNLPPELLSQVADFHGVADSPRRLAVVVDARGGDALEALQEVVQQLAQGGIRTAILFLDADDATIIRRYGENRRPHPLGLPTVEEAIAAEREMLDGLRESADVVIDTTDLNVHQLRDRVVNEFSSEAMQRPMRVSVRSFGYKHGTPRDADLVFDVRFLPNPHWVPELKPLRGTDDDVAQYVLSNPDAAEFVERIDQLISFLLPRYESEGKSYVSIAIGCTGGHHRSVAIAEELGKRLENRGIRAAVRHRDVER